MQTGQKTGRNEDFDFLVDLLKEIFKVYKSTKKPELKEIYQSFQFIGQASWSGARCDAVMGISFVANISIQAIWMWYT